jgi:molecular chaperone DnaK (HSP70)
MRLAHKFAAEFDEPIPPSPPAALLTPVQLIGPKALSAAARREAIEEPAQSESVDESEHAADPSDLMGGSLDRIRQTVAVLRDSDKRVRTMVEALEAANQRSQIELEAMQARLEAAEMRVTLEATRADAAEERCRETETRFGQILNSLADELEASSDVRAFLMSQSR